MFSCLKQNCIYEISLSFWGEEYTDFANDKRIKLYGIYLYSYFSTNKSLINCFHLKEGSRIHIYNRHPRLALRNQFLKVHDLEYIKNSIKNRHTKILPLVISAFYKLSTAEIAMLRKYDKNCFVTHGVQRLG